MKEDKGEWPQQAKLVAPDRVTEDKFGYSVALFGNTMIVSAYLDDGNAEDSG